MKAKRKKRTNNGYGIVIPRGFHIINTWRSSTTSFHLWPFNWPLDAQGDTRRLNQTTNTHIRSREWKGALMKIFLKVFPKGGGFGHTFKSSLNDCTVDYLDFNSTQFRSIQLNWLLYYHRRDTCHGRCSLDTISRASVQKWANEWVSVK